MPLKTKKYRKRRRRFRRKKQTVVQRGIVSNRQIVKLKYSEFFSLDPGINTAATYTFGANCMYDPNITGTGHQPLGFDQWMAFYNHFTVIGARIKATFVSAAAGATDGTTLCGVEIAPSSTATTNMNNLVEQGRARYRTVTNSTAEQKNVVTTQVSIKKFLGKNNLIDDTATQGSISSDPDEKVFFHVFAMGVNQTINPLALNCIAEIEYIAILHEPVNIPLS